MSDRIAVFHRGRIQQIDVADRIYEQPTNAFVARFIGENNRLAGVAEAILGQRCTVRLAAGQRITGLCGEPLVAGAPVVASVRPERIDIGPGAGPCRLTGTLAETIYLGDHLRLRVAVPGLGDVVAKLQLAHVSSLPVPGSPVSLAWQVDHCRVFRKEEE